jgi:VanZ family protein
LTDTHQRWRKWGLLLTCIGITVAILLAGLWPFQFHPNNDVTWLNGKNGIHFGQRGMAYTPRSVYGPEGAIRPSGPVSIEMVVRPYREFDHSISQILTLYGGGNHQFFTLAQWKSHLILRTASQGNDLHNDFREMGVKNVLLKNIPVFLAVISQKGNTSIYADGHMMNINKNFPIFPADSSVSGKFVLGNSPTGNSPWTGELLFLAAYDRELSAKEVLHHFRDWIAQGTPTWLPGNTPSLLYRFDERTGITSRNQNGDHYEISVPTTIRLLQQNVLAFPSKDYRKTRSFVKDTIFNIFVFIPFGFFCYMYFRKYGNGSKFLSMAIVNSIGSGISLYIELFQAYLPSRSSSLSDLFCNILGTIIGIIIFHFINYFHKQFKTDM